MKLYLLTRIDGFEYDEHIAVLVRAKNESEARNLATSQCYPKGVWLASDRTTCEVVKTAGNSGIIIESFNAG